ncbi:MAG: hypothetical protein R3B48_04750 [Kofleriaceae bacterium]
MIRSRRLLTSLLAVGLLGWAKPSLAGPSAPGGGDVSAPSGQPAADPTELADPYGAAEPAPSAPEPAPAPAPEPPATAPAPSAPPGAFVDPESVKLAEAVAFAVAARAQELLDAKQFADAKQLAIEAIARSPHGVAAERAQLILKAADRALGVDDPPPAPPAPPEEAPPVVPTAPEPEGRAPSGRRHAMIHGGLYGGLVGATLGSLITDQAGVEVAAGAAGAAAGAWFTPRLARRLDVEQVRTVGSASLWGGVLGGLLADVTTGLEDSSPRQILLGATLGSSLGALGGYSLARGRPFTRGDVALIDTLASVGAVGGLTLGLAMQPVETEGYSLNAALGATAGVVVGAIAAPQTNTTPRRMTRVAGASAIGAAAPWLLYAAIADGGTNNDEQVVGLLSTAGLLAGAYLGFRWTRGMDAGLDVHAGQAPKRDVDDAPSALLRRSSGGRLSLGGLALRTSLQAPQPAYVVELAAGRF